MKPWCEGCEGILIEGTECITCPKWESVKARYALVARRNALLEKKLLLAAQLIEHQVQNGGLVYVRASRDGRSVS